MNSVILIRHAKTIERDEWEENDSLRPLNDKGRKQARKLARFLENRYSSIDAIYSSSATRARDTARAIIKRFRKLELETSSKIDPDSGGANYATLIEEADNNGFKNIVIVGHEMDLSEAISMLCSNGEIRLHLSKASMVELRPNKDGVWQIEAIIPPLFF
ncbi:MAG: SixA phosphatase family protein [Wolinella sp.]